MNDFYPIRHNRLNNDMSIIKKLQLKQKQLEEQALHSKKPEALHRFKAHPNLIQCESDTVTSHTPRAVIKTNFSASTTKLAYEKSSGQNRFSHSETQQRARKFHKLLHEKLSMIDSNPSEKSYHSGDAGGDHSHVERYQNHRIKHSISGSSLGSLSDSDKEFTNVRCKSGELRRKNIKCVNRRTENVRSAPIKTVNSERDRKIAARRVSSQQGLPESVFERKLKVVVMKSLQNIAKIREILTKGVLPPDGKEDESRRRVRAKEFSNRFSRNYLYPLARQLSDLNAIDQLNPLLINQKLLSTYQALQNALLAYHNYLPQSLRDCTHNQLKILMDNIKEVCDIHRNNLENTEESYLVEFIDTFKINAELAIQKIQEASKLSNDIALKAESKASLTKCKKANIKNGGPKADKRFSMYTSQASFRKDKHWTKTMENLTKKKVNVQSRYKTATYKHRPPIQKEPEIIPLSKFRTAYCTKSGNLKQTRLNTPVNEDCIKTMVEAEENGETHYLEKEEWENMEKKSEAKEVGDLTKEQILMKLLQLTLKNNIQDSVAGNKSQITELLTMIKNQPNNANFLQEIFNGVIDTNGEEKEGDNTKLQQQLTLEIKRSHCSVDGSSGGRTNRREPKVTVTGDKNARLICITDDNSLIEPSEEKNGVVDELLHQINGVEKKVEPENITVKNVESGKLVTKTSSETQTDMNGIKKKASKTAHKGKHPATIRISRLKKFGRNLKPLDKQQALVAIQYKLDFFKYCKNNLLYKKSNNCQPWLLMDKFSEELLNDCFLTIAREIEVNDVVDKVYQGELQL